VYPDSSFGKAGSIPKIRYSCLSQKKHEGGEKMRLTKKEQSEFLANLQEKIWDIDFGHICCNFVISDSRLMYIDFKREKSERVYVHSKQDINEGVEK